MSLSRRTINSLLAGAPLVGSLPLLSAHAQAQSKKDTLVLAMILEPTPGLDPTMASAAAIGEIVHYNIFEGLTKIAMDGAVTPLLAESWQASGDDRTYSFSLKKGVRFSDGSAWRLGGGAAPGDPALRVSPLSRLQRVRRAAPAAPADPRACRPAQLRPAGALGRRQALARRHPRD